MPRSSRPGELVEQHAGVDDDTVADHVGDTGRQDARRDQVQREVLARRQDHGVPGVVAALVAHHPLHAPTEQIGGFTFALVAPLGADEDDCRHGVSPADLRYSVQPVTHPIGAHAPGVSLTNTEIAVLRFGGRRLPRRAGLIAVPATSPTPTDIDAAVEGVRRVVVVGADADLAAVLTRLMRLERLDVEVAARRRRAGCGARRATNGCGATCSADPRRDRHGAGGRGASGCRPARPASFTVRPSSTTPCCSTAR